MPSGLAPHDWHEGASIAHKLYALIEGIEDGPQSFPWLTKRTTSRGPSRQGSRGPSPRLSRSNSRLPIFNASAPTPPDPAEAVIHDMSIIWKSQESHSSPQAERAEWLRGNVEAERGIWPFYNPDPSGGISRLEVRKQGRIPHLGEYDIQLFSDTVSRRCLRGWM
jgi:hypothetical protein